MGENYQPLAIPARKSYAIGVDLLRSLQRYCHDVVAISVDHDVIRQKAFRQQLTAVTRGMRPLIPLALVLVGIALIVFWRRGDRPLLLGGAAISALQL